MHTRRWYGAVRWFAAVWLGAAGVAVATPLDDYVAQPDPAYSWRLVASVDGDGYTDFILDMKSQTWLGSEQVDRTLWQHYLIVTRPDTVNHTTGFLFIDGGRNGGAVPTGNDPALIDVARSTRSVVARLRQVPNQPLTFTGQEPWTEDALIAYGWRLFLEGAGPEWLMRLPMTKAAVRAMDTVTAFCSSDAAGRINVDTFVVGGASKRGWTTWTTAAADPRVVAIAPLVIDVLNMEASFRHHFDALGFYQPAVEDYTRNGIMDWFGHPRLEELQSVVDPYWYRDRLVMPKYIINSTGDEFFLPDSSKFYFPRLRGENRLRYIPNTGHDLDERAVDGLIGWYWAILNGVPRPEVTWVRKADGSLEIDTHGSTPSQVLLWQGTNPDSRDFSIETAGPVFQSTPLAPSAPFRYVASVPEPPTGYTAFLVELRFDVGGPQPLAFTTEVSIVPDPLPFGPRYALAAPTEFVSDDFYDGDLSDASNVAGRELLYPSPSHDGRRVAFWGRNRATGQSALFVVPVGHPDEWRRISVYVDNVPDGAPAWTPDDRCVFAGPLRYRVPVRGTIATPERIAVHGHELKHVAFTAMPAGNWAFTVAEDAILALPVLPDGRTDVSRQPAVVVDLGETPGSPAELDATADGSSLTFAVVTQTRVASRGDVYVLHGVAEILAGNSATPTSLDDERIVPIRTVESDDFASAPSLSQDGTLVLFNERSDTASGLYVTPADAWASDARLETAGDPSGAALTLGGMRAAYALYQGDRPRGFLAPLRTTISIAGVASGDSVITEEVQQLEDGSGVRASLPKETVFTVLPGSRHDILVETPALPPVDAELPAGYGRVVAVRRIGPANATFAPPLAVTLAYADAEARNLDEASLRVYRYDPAVDRFTESVPVVDRDAAANTLTFELDRGGTFAVLGAGEPDDDADGLPNAVEERYGLDPRDPQMDADYDGDADGLTDIEEVDGGTDPLAADSDGDGYWDGLERARQSDPNDPASVPADTGLAADLDRNGIVDAVDIQIVVNGVLQRPTPAPSDINGDAVTDSVDVQLAVNAVLGIG